MTEEIKTLVIDRSRWDRGAGGSALVMANAESDRRGKMCCLGFFGASLGGDPSKYCKYSEADDHETRAENGILGLPYPRSDQRFWPDWGFERDPDNGYNQIWARIAIINDDVNISEEMREMRVTEEFAKHGVTVTFVDGETG